MLLLLLATVSAQYQANWDSLDTRATPAWFDQVKFGIFIHWGVYSVPAWAPVGTYAEWYWNDLVTDPTGDTAAFHNKTYGSSFQYQDFAQRFTAELFDPVEWADLFVASGAKYVVLTSKHHEGYCLWPSAQSWNWNSVDLIPHRDLIGDLLAEVRSRPGMHPGMYFSLYEWFNPLYTGSDPQSYVQEIMLPQMYDLINRYEPHVFWTDGDWDYDSSFWNSCEFLQWLYNNSTVKDVIAVNDRWGSDTPGVHGGYYTPEYSSTTYSSHKWEENSGIDIHSYGLNRNTPAQQYWSAKALVDLLVRSVCFGGNLLLDIGPNWDGRIPAIMQERLLSIGGWLGVNGEAIYNTSAWRVQQEIVISSPVTWVDVDAGQNNVYGQVPPAGNSSTNNIWYLGSFNSAQQCQSSCGSLSQCISYTWHDATMGSYANMCYGRVDGTWSPTAQTGTYSGRKQSVTVSYTTTTNNGNVFAIVSNWLSGGQKLTLPSPIYSSSTTVTLLGYNGTIAVSGTSGQPGVTITYPQLGPDDVPCDYDWSFKLVNVK